MDKAVLKRKLEEILSLEANWDDEDALRIERETAEKAQKYIPLMEKKMQEKGWELSEPLISAVPDGSIDVKWKTKYCEVLLNVPPKDKLPEYYGDNYSTDTIKGKL